MNVPALRIELDAHRACYHWLHTHSPAEWYLRHQPESTEMHNLVEAMVEDGRFGTLRGLWCIWGYHKVEVEWEKRVLGEGYDSSRQKKYSMKFGY